MTQSALSPRVEMMRARLEAAASQLVVEHQDDAWMIDQVAEAKALVEDYIAAYEEGKPFYAREMLASLDRQIDALQAGAAEDEDAVVTIEDVVGRVESWPLTVPGSMKEERDTYVIHYCSHQDMTHMSLKFPDTLLEFEKPVSIAYSNATKPSGWPLADLEAALRAHQTTWRQSTECDTLVRILTTTPAAASIRKIVCFGLGRLDDRAQTTHEALATSVQSAATQHAAALTMAEALTGNTGEVVRCYAQDPAYADVEKALLAKLGITVLEDPKGFLEVDEHTLVFSVSPNVPVRQIVADVSRPAAMVWNMIESDRENEKDRDYRMDTEWGREVRISPWCTDEGSTRVTEMGNHYTHFPFAGNRSTDHFGRIGIYVKK